MFKKIKCLKRIQKKTPVYNFDVPDYETYIANGFAVHNCQNFRISQTTSGPSRKVLPSELAEMAVQKGVSGIAFSYNEPLLYYDYIERLGEVTDLPIVVKTNGFINLEILQKLVFHVKAFNVDIKGDDAEYRRIMGGWLEPVKKSIEWISASDSHLEVSYLVLPNQIDDFEYHDGMRSWLSGLSADMPLHLLYYFPFHRMKEPAYDIDALVRVRDFFRAAMNYVYISNWHGADSKGFRDTVCPSCQVVLISRKRKIKTESLKCHEGKLPGKFE